MNPVTAAIEGILARTEEADDALRQAVAVLADVDGVTWAGIAFVEAGELVLGPGAGVPDASRRRQTAISFHGERVGELWLDGQSDEIDEDGVAALLAAHVLIGWDTSGDAWDP